MKLFKDPTRSNKMFLFQGNIVLEYKCNLEESKIYIFFLT